jgi:cell division ATPase FtsA
MIRPAVEHTIRILQRAIQGTGTEPDALNAVVLVGGCAHVPLITELVMAAVRLLVVPAQDPTTAIARGAALAGGRVAKPTVRAQPAVAPTVTPTESVSAHTDLMRFDDMGPEVADIGPPPPRPPVEIPALDPPPRGLARLTRRARNGAEVDELDRDQRSWDFEEDDRTARADKKETDKRQDDIDEPPRRRRNKPDRTEDDEDDE